MFLVPFLPDGGGVPLHDDTIFREQRRNEEFNFLIYFNHLLVQVLCVRPIKNKDDDLAITNNNAMIYTVYVSITDFSKSSRTVLFACSCKYERMEFGCKGKACVHVRIADIEAGMVNIGDKRRISNFSHTKGAARKQQS